jgi:shikimate kinase
VSSLSASAEVDPEGHPWERIVLVGFMGSGKSTVGAALAQELAWRFVDLDQAVETRAGRSIPAIFREEGEAFFREMEEREARSLLDRREIVLATGGGWPCRPGRLASTGEGTLTIWLKVSPEAALQRTTLQEVERPLLDVEDPAARIRELLGEREPYYRKARWWVDTTLRSPPEVVREVVDRLRSNPERPLRV